MPRKRSHRPRGRPKGRETVPFALRLAPDLKRDLEIIRDLLDGRPPVNGLIQTAVRLYIDTKLTDPGLRKRYEKHISPRLQVAS